jgi:hypothetical protein
MKTSSLNKEDFIRVLKQCFTGGAIPECVICNNRKQISIEAIDMSSSIAVSIQQPLRMRMEEKRIGIGNVELLLSFLSSLKGSRIKIDVEDNVMNIYSTDQRRKLKYLLTDPSLVATAVEEEGTVNKIIERFEHKVKITPDEVKDILSYVKISTNKTVSITAEDDSIIVRCGTENEHQFYTQLSDPTDAEGIHLTVNGELLGKILSNLIFTGWEDPATPCLLIGEDLPLGVINHGAFWALTPISEGE